MYRRSLSNLLGGSLLVATVAALNACGGGAAGGDTTTPSAGSTGTPTNNAGGTTGSAGKPAGTTTTTASAGAKAPGGTTTSGVTSAAGKSGSAGSSATATAGTTGAAGGGTSAAAGGSATAGSTGGGAAGGAAAAAGSSGGATTGGPLKYTGMFTMGMTFPKENRCPTVGDNKSPALSWSGGPAETKSYALVLYDTGFSLLHYALWDIPASVHELPAGLASGYELMSPMGAHQAAAMCNNQPAYCGPCSGEGTLVQQASTYELRLYALKVDKLGLMESSTAAQAQTAIESMMLEKAVWTGKPE